MLRSWAVPKGVPPTSQEDRLAIAVPDHDLDHLTYTDEHKFIADIGTWEDTTATTGGWCSPCTGGRTASGTR